MSLDHIDALVAQLAAIVGPEQVSSKKVDLLAHSFDATQHHFAADIVVHPGSTAEVAAIVQIAARHKIPILARGAGSGFTGGALPIHGGIVLVLTRMDRILEIDTDNLIAVVEPGVVTASLQNEVEKLGLF